MLNIKGDMFLHLEEYDAACITTNGTVKEDGSCVMGRGVAAIAKKRWPGIDHTIGLLIKLEGNHCRTISIEEDTLIIAFPVKHQWFEKADIKLIEQSCVELNWIADYFCLQKILLPRPGCGNGQLDYKDVEPILQKILDDRFYVIDF